ncbi:hypothetical protein [Microcystis phage Mvi-JY20]|uniref:Uncharacterized protein n=1 Tax=Microcystis phage Mvi-JY20 TaxID=3128146 RepID=A0AAX4QH39_9CAUD
MTNPEITNLKIFVYVGQLLNANLLIHQYAAVDMDFAFEDALTKKNVQSEIVYVGLTDPVKAGMEVGQAALVRVINYPQTEEPMEVEYIMDYKLNPSPVLDAWLSLWKQGQIGIKIERIIRWVPLIKPLLEHLQQKRIDSFLRQLPKDVRSYVLTNIYRDALEAD